MTGRSANISGKTGSVSDSSNDIEVLTKEIDENSTEHRKIMKIFDKAMNDFASDRSLDTCLEVLNASIQMANIRHKLLQSYKHYSKLLEIDLSRLHGRNQIPLNKD
jgi:hypothetical protein